MIMQNIRNIAIIAHVDHGKTTLVDKIIHATSVFRENQESGELIMDTFGIGPSKEVGFIKNTIKEAILEGIIRNDYDEAYQLMLEEALKLGLKKVENLK